MQGCRPSGPTGGQGRLARPGEVLRWLTIHAEDFGHVPVLLRRCVELLTPALTRHHADGSGAVLVDATLGAGGHAERFLTDLPGLRLIGLDRDPSALDIARARLARFADRITLVHTRYDGLAAALAESGYGTTESVDGMLFDLGVSSMQLDRAERGFAYAQDAPLDMRMDPESPLTAADIVNTYDEAALADILHRYGEERFARRIAAQIVRQRARAPFTSTAELVALLYQAIPAPARRTGGTSGQADLPGPADRGQRRTGLVAQRDSGRVGRAHRRRAHGGAGLSIAGRPDRQTRCSPTRSPPAHRWICRSSFPATSRDSGR